MMRVADNVGDAGAGLFARRKAEQNRPRAFRRTQDAHGRLSHDAELAFRADHQAEKIEAGTVEMIAADLDNRAVDEH